MRSWLLPTELFARVTGGGPAVVLLHGQPGEAADWDLVVDALEGQVTTIVPDRPGYGRTGGAPAGIADNADAVVALLDRLSVDRAVIVGYSWAGAVALDLAQQHASRVAGLALVAAVGAEGSVDDIDRALSAPIIGPALALGGLAMLQLPVIRRMVGAEAADRLPRASLATWRSFVVEQRAMVAELPAITSQLPATTVPAVVVVTGADRVVRPAVQHTLAALLPDAEIAALPDAGHLAPWEHPREVAGAIRRVVERWVG